MVDVFSALAEDFYRCKLAIEGPDGRKGLVPYSGMFFVNQRSKLTWRKSLEPADFGPRVGTINFSLPMAS